MPAFSHYSLPDFLSSAISTLLAELTLAYARSGFSEMHTDQALTWSADLTDLQQQLSLTLTAHPQASAWQVLFELSIPRKEHRIDVVLLAGGAIVLLELKRGAPSSDALHQVEQYALLLHYFHKPSDQQHIYPIVLSPEPATSAPLERSLLQSSLPYTTLPSFWIAPTQVLHWSSLPTCLTSLPEIHAPQIDAHTWLNGRYCPTPTIIEAAQALRTGLHIREIAQSEAAEHDIASVTDTIAAIVASAQAHQQHVICFLTGVPGSGKTLVGLSLAHLSEDRANAIHFMSGNGPLVKVLQELFRRQAMRDGVPANQALIQAKTLIENVHVFAKTYTDDDPDRAPSNHVIIFDEAQRAWNLRQNRSKFGRNYSEPEMLLSIMQRHSDWAVVIALVGGGQEINNGEAGLEEWGRALSASTCNWEIHASPEVLLGGTSTAGHQLFDSQTTSRPVHSEDKLHLRTSNRSLRAETLSHWVNLVLEGNHSAAKNLKITSRFPVFLTRSLDDTRRKLRSEALAQSRFGLVASSAATRLRAEGLEPSSDFHAAYPWHHWYLAPREDIRSSYACEVHATEFEIQGLELDWIGLCWGGDLIWTGTRWLPRELRYTAQTRWSPVKSTERKTYRINAYRVLLTRARQGMVLFVPSGDAADSTRNPGELDATADYLSACGVDGL